MNNFKNLLEGKSTKKDSKERLESTVSFEVEIPLDNYKDKGSLFKKYASRDTLTAEEVALQKILELMKIKRIPLNIEITAEYKKQNFNNTIFTVHVNGADERFLLKLLDSL